MKNTGLKIILFFLGICGIVAFLLIVVSKEIDGKEFKAIVPKEATLLTTWRESIPSNTWDLEQSIPIILESGDTTIGYLYSDNSNFPGRRFVEYKNNFPPAIGKELIVSGHVSDGKYWIDTEAVIKQ